MWRELDVVRQSWHSFGGRMKIHKKMMNHEIIQIAYKRIWKDPESSSEDCICTRQKEELKNTAWWQYWVERSDKLLIGKLDENRGLSKRWSSDCGFERWKTWQCLCIEKWEREGLGGGKELVFGYVAFQLMNVQRRYEKDWHLKGKKSVCEGTGQKDLVLEALGLRMIENLKKLPEQNSSPLVNDTQAATELVFFCLKRKAGSIWHLCHHWWVDHTVSKTIAYNLWLAEILCVLLKICVWFCCLLKPISFSMLNISILQEVYFLSVVLPSSTILV